ncbi:class I SAM-dependent methyltransferase [Hydrogenimonas sp.]
MPNIEPFEKLTEHYDHWFEEHSKVYAEELKAIKALLPPFEKGIEIGVGTGRFAAPLGIKTGLEPSRKMAQIAKTRGIEVIPGQAEAIPLPDDSYDFALMVTTICFVDDAKKALQEIWRILKPGGFIIVGFVDKETPLGRLYQKNKEKSRFYKTAHFFSGDEVMSLLRQTGFSDCKAVQTLFGPDLAHMQGGLKDGYGEGAFVAIRCKKPRKS